MATEFSSETRATIPLQVRNRANVSRDGFGLLSFHGVIPGAVSDESILFLHLGGEEHRLPADEALWPQEEQSRQIEFHLVSHLAPNGLQSVTATLVQPNGSHIDFSFPLLNLRNDTPLAHQVAQDLRDHGTPLLVGRIIDSSLFPFDSGTARAWFNEVDGDNIPMSLEPAPDADHAQRHLLKWGFCVLHEQLPVELVQSFKTELNEAIETGELTYRVGSSDRIHGAHQKLSSARAVWLYPPVINFLENYFKDTACACQTLTYVNGSEQGAHQDSIHLTPYPSGFMCGVWVALQDVEENSGELFVYPGSHRSGSIRARDLNLKKIENDDYSHYYKFDAAIHDLIEQEGYQRLIYRPKAGQILVWHENLIHGGSPRLDLDRARLSVVSHYFAKGSIGFYDSRGEAAALETLAKL
ncbi:hypothetical protein TomMM35A_33880 [Sphingobium sp. TomMM35A]